jgi:hypothetical protein
VLEHRVPLVILPAVCRAHCVQVADLYVIVKTQHVGGEGTGVISWDKLVSILFLIIAQWVNCGHGVCPVKVLIEFLNAPIHFGAWRFTLIPVIHHHRHKCFPITPTAWTGVLDTFDGIPVGVDVLKMGLIDGSML